MSGPQLQLLHLLQLVSPALPVGAFSYSEGLEVLVQQGGITGPVPLKAWLGAELERGAVALEAAALGPLGLALAAWQADPRGTGEAQLRDLDGWLLAQREAPELRAQQRQMGRSLLQLLAELGWPLPGGVCDLGWPAAWAWAGHCLELPQLALLEGYLYGWLANQLSAAVRLVPLGATTGQRLQLELAPVLRRRAEQLLGADPRQLWSGAVGAGLAQLQHGSLYSRLFRS